MNNELLIDIKKKREFSNLPDSLIKKAALICKDDPKSIRALLRKYIGVFLTNKIFKIKDQNILERHISSKDREYSVFYNLLGFNSLSNFNSVLDLGCGVNGFSYPNIIKSFGREIPYLGLEAVGQIVDNTNNFFKENNFSKAKLIKGDLFDLDNLGNLVVSQKSPRAIFMFQIIDALEGMERNSSKKLLTHLYGIISKEDEVLISMPMKSISGKSQFEAKRTWLRVFLESIFNVEEFFLGNERIFRCRKK